MAERELWQHVVLLAVHDALSPNKVSDTKNGGMLTPRDKQVARDWISKGGAKFRQVCSLAGIDPDFLRDAFNAGRIDHERLMSAASASRMSAEQYRAARTAQNRRGKAGRSEP